MLHHTHSYLIWRSSMIHKIIVERIKKNVGERKCVFYGKYDQYMYELRENGIIVQDVYTGNLSLLADPNGKYIDHNELLDKSDQYYVIIPFILGDGTNQKNNMEKFGYVRDKDYTFLVSDSQFVMNGSSYDITDENLNSIQGKCDKVSISIKGFGNTVTFGNNIKVSKQLKIVIHGNDSTVHIGDNVVVKGEKMFLHILRDDSEIIIGNKSVLTSGEITCIGAHTSFIVNEGTTFGADFIASLNEKTRIRIGKDCMFSLNIIMYAGDGHSLFDVETSKNINSIVPDGKRFCKEIILGDHCWVGVRATILSANIGQGSIIGAGSVVKGRYPNNCAIAGSPARIVRKNCCWARRNMSQNIDDCNGYVEYTEELM